MQEQVEQKKKLRLAALCGNAARVNELLSSGTTLDGVEDPNDRLSLLTRCIQFGHIDVVHVLLDHGASARGEYRPGQTVPFKQSPLYYALSYKSDEIARVLIQHPSDNLLAYYKAEESDVLQQAVKNNHLAFTQLLLGNGYDATCRDASGNTLLHLAVEGNDPELVALLSQYPSNHFYQEETPFMLALRLNHFNLISLIIPFDPILDDSYMTEELKQDIEKLVEVSKKKFDLKQWVFFSSDEIQAVYDSTQSTNNAAIARISIYAYMINKSLSCLTNEIVEVDWTLEKAISQDRDDLVRYYLDEDVSYSWKNIFDDHGNSLLTTAIEKGSLCSAAVLIEYGADLAGEPCDGKTFKSKYANSKRYPGDWGGSLDTSNGRYTPIHMAIKHQHEDFAFDILNSLMDSHELNHKEFLNFFYESVNPHSSSGKAKLLTQAIQSGCLNLVRYMMQNKWDVNSHDSEGITPLMNALACKQDKIALLLIACGADINAVSRDGSTPLIHAAMTGNKNMVKLLIEFGVEIHDSYNTLSTMDMYERGRYLRYLSIQMSHPLNNTFGVLEILTQEVKELINSGPYCPEYGKKVRDYCAIYNEISASIVAQQNIPARAKFNQEMSLHLSLTSLKTNDGIFPSDILYLVISYLDISDIWHLWRLSQPSEDSTSNNAYSNNLLLVTQAYNNMTKFQAPAPKKLVVYKREFDSISSNFFEEHKNGDEDEYSQKKIKSSETEDTYQSLWSNFM